MYGTIWNLAFSEFRGYTEKPSMLLSRIFIIEAAIPSILIIPIIEIHFRITNHMSGPIRI